MKAFLKQPHTGFTLMEVMVAVSIFAIIVTIGIGSLLTVNAAYRKSQSDRQAIDSLTFTLESMSRRLRTAQSWDPNTVYGSPVDFITFVDQEGATVTYSWGGANDPKMYMDYQCNGCQNPSLADSIQPYEMTPANVTITNMSFLPLTSPGSGQPYVQINVAGIVTTAGQEADFAFQTGVSKRSLGMNP